MAGRDAQEIRSNPRWGPGGERHPDLRGATDSKRSRSRLNVVDPLIPKSQPMRAARGKQISLIQGRGCVRPPSGQPSHAHLS
eukprot:11865350-Heterocapsa_arctica.AAC.1